MGTSRSATTSKTECWLSTLPKPKQSSRFSSSMRSLVLSERSSRLSTASDLGPSSRTSGTDDAARVTGGAPFTTGHLYTILNNPLYIGKVRHKELIHPGEHQAILSEELWHLVQARLAANSVERAAGTGVKSPSLLVGRIFGGDGNRLTPSHAVKGAKRYRYYVEATATDVSEPRLRIPAGDIERLVTNALRSFLIDPVRLLEAFTIDAQSPSQMRRVIAGLSISSPILPMRPAAHGRKRSGPLLLECMCRCRTFASKSTGPRSSQSSKSMGALPTSTIHCALNSPSR